MTSSSGGGGLGIGGGATDLGALIVDPYFAASYARLCTAVNAGGGPPDVALRLKKLDLPLAASGVGGERWSRTPGLGVGCGIR
jgi:hypothetical protein